MNKTLPLLTALLLPLFTACSDKGQEEPHQPTLYDICEVAPTSGNPAVLYLYRPDGDTPAILTATGQTLGDHAPEAGQSLLVAYRPLRGIPYVSDNITILQWASITNIPLAEAKNSGDLEGWDRDPVELMSTWRAGNKICMRLRLPYSTEPRRFALILDPATASDPIPTAYLYHARPNATENFSRQYYVAFDIATLWTLPSTEGLRIRLADSATPSRSTLLFTKI